MQRILIMILALALILIMPATALAEGETEEPTQDADPEPDAATSLEIDNSNVYENMEKAYKDGYNPKIKDGKAIVVLPLVATGDIKDNSITATPNLGGASGTPFQYSNYQKTVNLSDNPVGGGSTISSYLVRFDLPLIKDRFNGVYPVSIDIQAEATDGTPIQKQFTTYVMITDGKDPNAPEPTPKEKKPKPQPKIIVSRYNINPYPVTADEAFTADITIKNTSESQSVKNMGVTVSCDCQNFMLQNDSNAIYIGKLGKGEETTVQVSYETDLDTPPGRYNISLNMEYDNSEATTLSSSGTVPVTITQPLRVELETPQIPESVNAGDTMPLSFQVMNMGRSKIYNVRIELDAPGLIPSETAFIGNMEPGTAMPGDMNVFIGTKNMSEGYEEEDRYGYTSGKITLIYEDADGQEYTGETEIATMINQPVITTDAAAPEEEPETAGQWWISVIVGAVVIAGLTAFLIIRGRKGKQHETY